MIYLYNNAYSFALLEQPPSTGITTTTATTTDSTTTTTVVTTTAGSIDNIPVPMPRNMSSSDSNKVSQKRNSAGHISPGSLAKDVPSTTPHKPKPKPRKLKPATNTGNEQMSFSALPDTTSSTAGNMDTMNPSQNISNLPVPHGPPVLEQFLLCSGQSTDVVENFQSM